MNIVTCNEIIILYIIIWWILTQQSKSFAKGAFVQMDIYNCLNEQYNVYIMYHNYSKITR